MKKFAKRICQLTACIFSVFVLSSCGSNEIDSSNTTLLAPTEFPAQTNPNIDQFETGYDDFGDMVAEQDYGNIICFTDNESYPQDFEKIIITVQNQNEGKGFYIYRVPFIEKKINDEWERLNYSQETLLYGDDNWGFCGIEDRKDIKYSTELNIWYERLKDTWTVGDYRVVIFVGKEVIYAPFTIN